MTTSDYSVITTAIPDLLARRRFDMSAVVSLVKLHFIPFQTKRLLSAILLKILQNGESIFSYQRVANIRRTSRNARLARD